MARGTKIGGVGSLDVAAINKTRSVVAALYERRIIFATVADRRYSKRNLRYPSPTGRGG